MYFDPQKKYQEIAEAITRFCVAELNAEFKEVCFFVLEKLRRKRLTPLISGKANTWACGIVYAVCSNNFVFDRSKPYYMSAQDVAGWFNLPIRTAQNKSAEIKKMLKISHYTPEYVIASLQDHTRSLIEIERSINLFRKILKSR